jgi:hypothetical protein
VTSPTHPSPARRRNGILAIVALAFACAALIQPLGWAQTSHYALVRALGHGTPKIDRYQWETRDKSYYRGHFYAVKGPGLAFVSLPLYKLLDTAGGEDASRWAARRARAEAAGRWSQGGRIPETLYGNQLERALRVRQTIEAETGMVWVLGLLGSVLPLALLLLLVRACAERIEPGYGTAAAISAGVGTLLFPFATMFFSHVLSALLGFAAFALLWREREGPQRLLLVGAAGVLAGLAVTTEYPLAIVGAIVGLYAIARERWFRRGLVYSAGVLAGVTPLIAYNLWAFGTLAHNSYSDAVKVQGESGHAVLGLNDGGLFGIGLPSPRVAAELLLAPRGLLVLSPVLVAGAVGTVLLYRRGRRAEALTIGGIALSFLVYNAGYYLPFGGGSPGPRFLIPVLPFLGVPLAIAYRRFPAATLALALCSAATILAATVTQPLLGNDATGYWAHVVGIASFEHTVATIAGAGNGWGGLVPVIAALALTAALAIAATPRTALTRGALPAAAAVSAWAVVALAAPLLGHEGAGDYERARLLLVLVPAVASLALVAAAALAARRPWLSRAAEPLAERPGSSA